ncbi:MAG: UDP-N-acetylmuramate dehydrogenase [Eubacterium sp.]|nr:UDP-N-acetylmuramate dehydrogenase [Eubacterium sp.]
MIRLEQEMMSKHTTFCVGGPAAFYLVPETMEEVPEALRFAREKKLPFYLIGRGSNILVGDGGYDGVIIEIGKGLEKIEFRPDGTVEAQAGISLARMASRLADRGLTGFEFASGIPGTLGGAITMNAGAYGGEIKDCIKSATVLTESGDRLVLDKEKMELGYRSSIVQKERYIVLSAIFSFEKGEPEQIKAQMKELNRKRREKQPLEYPSAGSTFKRPEGYFAGKLIEDAGLRGYRVGDAQVSEKHCGFVVNRGHATAAQIRQLMQDVQDTVKEKFQVDLEPEVRMIGKF